jgi:hypothetical protein
MPPTALDPAQMPRLQEIHANLIDRLQEARDQGWLGAGSSGVATEVGHAKARSGADDDDRSNLVPGSPAAVRRARTTSECVTVLPPTSPLRQPSLQRPGSRPPTR